MISASVMPALLGTPYKQVKAHLIIPAVGWTNMRNLAERVAAALAHANIDQADLARLVKVKPPSVNDWLSGKTKSLKANTAIAAARALGVNADWLANGRGRMLEKPELDSGETDHDGPQTKNAAAITNQRQSEGFYRIPKLDIKASMGNGVRILDSAQIVDYIELNVPELCRSRGVKITAPENLCIVTGMGGSMRPTFDDGDPLLIDCGVYDLKVDDVYCLENNDELYIKRFQRVPGKKDAYLMISDNKKFKDIEIQDPLRSGFRVAGRVVIAINFVKV
ncbi:MAG: S24 family peptidase [Pseudomonadota bacterium]